MARIRTVKPEVAKHELLFELEQELHAPVRFAWAILPCHCDREGRFKWRPRSLKTDILPYDDCDFSRVLDAWVTRGMLVKYRVGNEWYGVVPTFGKHQSVNPREAATLLPDPKDADEVIDLRNQQPANASATRDPRVNDASATRHNPAGGEGKGREGKGTGREGNALERVPDASETESQNGQQSAPLTPGDSESEAFEGIARVTAAYPIRAGRTDWDRAEHHCRVLIDRGETWQSLEASAERYAAYSKATAAVGTQHVMMPGNFFSASDRPWSQPWSLPRTKAESQQDSNIEAGLAFLSDVQSQP